MTPRQFIQDFLKVSEQDYPFLEINTRLMEEICEGWLEKKKKELNLDKMAEIMSLNLEELKSLDNFVNSKYDSTGNGLNDLIIDSNP